MNRLTRCVVVALALAITTLTVGCTSTDSHPRDSQANANPYAGGNGAFGEDPANPGEYASAHVNAR